jgi:hypothetical protein
MSLFDTSGYDCESDDDSSFQRVVSQQQQQPMQVEEKKNSDTDSSRIKFNSACVYMIQQAHQAAVELENIVVKSVLKYGERAGREYNEADVDAQQDLWSRMFPEFGFCRRHNNVAPAFLIQQYAKQSSTSSSLADCGMCTGYSESCHISWTSPSLDDILGITVEKVCEVWKHQRDCLDASTMNDNAKGKEDRNMVALTSLERFKEKNAIAVLEAKAWLRYKALKMYEAMQIRERFRQGEKDIDPYDLFIEIENHAIRRNQKAAEIFCPIHHKKICSTFPLQLSTQYNTQCFYCELPKEEEPERKSLFRLGVRTIVKPKHTLTSGMQ